MARKDKVLEILALSELPEDAKLSRLVRPWLGKAFPHEQAKAIIKCYFDANGRLPELTQKLVDEKLRQERLRNERSAFKAAAQKRAEPSMNKYKPEIVGPATAKFNRKERAMELAKKTFGPHVRENFSEDALAMMSLISGEDRWYEVRWKEAGFYPVRSALIEVVTMAKEGSAYNRFLLYKVNGRVLVARTTAHDLQAAWGGQLPQLLVEAAAEMKAEGYTFRSDLEDQSMIVYNPDGTEYRRVPWSGRTVDD
jgi:hypothetical protein